MGDSRNFLDNLKNLRVVTSVALEHLQENGSQFAKKATGSQLREFERYVSQIRTLAKQLEKEIDTIEYLASKRGP